MLDLSQTRVELSMELPIADTVSAVEEGMCLQWVVENGQAKIVPSTGASSNNQFAGVAMSYFTTPSTATWVDVLTVDATALTVTLSWTPATASDITVANAIANPDTAAVGVGVAPLYVPSGSPLTYQAGNPPASSGNYTVTGNVVTFNSNMAGKLVYVSYRYNVTAQQALALVGDGIVATKAADITGTIGVIQKGLVYTNMFDTGVNWDAADVNNITMAASGLFSIGGSGGAVRATVYSVPSAEVPFLGIMLY